MVILIVQGEVQKRGTKDLEFVAACLSEKQVFDVIKKYKNYMGFKVCRYDIKNNKWIGSSKYIWPNQVYNHAKDGHLDPPENRNHEGLCNSRGLWGPYCEECAKLLLANMNMDFE